MRSVERQLGRLPEGAATLACALAVLGERARVDELAQVTGRAVDAVLGDLDLLRRAEFVDAEAPTRFLHPILGQAAYESIPAGERLRLHAAAASATRRHDVGRAAFHLMAAGDLPLPAWGTDVLRRAASAALTREGGAEAAGYLSHALQRIAVEDRQRPQLLLELGTVEAELRRPEALERLARRRS